jgi:hypothetical protein
MTTTKEAIKKAESAQGAQVAKEERVLKLNQVVERFKPEPARTAEERILRNEQFHALSERYKHLKSKAHDLEIFERGNDKTNAEIIFKNQAGFEFKVKNSNVIKTLIEAGRRELNVLLAEAENEILTFDI